MTSQRLYAAFAVALATACATTTNPSLPTALASGELAEPAARLVLVGDAGRSEAEEHLVAVADWIARDDVPTRVLFLGDNFYPRAEWTDPALRRAILDPQRALGRVPSDVVFVPGNHDWRVNGNGAPLLDRVSELSRAASPARWRPAPGERGPEVIEELGFRVIALDSDQWIARREPERLRAAEAALRDELACAGCGASIVVAHHPLTSSGPHGDCASAARRLLRFDQDLHSTPYREYVRAIEAILREHPPLLFAAGHDHSLQVAVGAWDGAHVVSGAGSELTRVCAQDAPLSWSAKGFMSVERAADGGTRLRVFRFGDPASCGAKRFCEIHRQPLTARSAP